MFCLQRQKSQQISDAKFVSQATTTGADTGRGLPPQRNGRIREVSLRRSPRPPLRPSRRAGSPATPTVPSGPPAKARGGPAGGSCGRFRGPSTPAPGRRCPRDDTAPRAASAGHGAAVPGSCRSGVRGSRPRGETDRPHLILGGEPDDIRSGAAARDDDLAPELGKRGKRLHQFGRAQPESGQDRTHVHAGTDPIEPAGASEGGRGPGQRRRGSRGPAGRSDRSASPREGFGPLHDARGDARHDVCLRCQKS